MEDLKNFLEKNEKRKALFRALSNKLDGMVERRKISESQGKYGTWLVFFRICLEEAQDMAQLNEPERCMILLAYAKIIGKYIGKYATNSGRPKTHTFIKKRYESVEHTVFMKLNNKENLN